MATLCGRPPAVSAARTTFRNSFSSGKVATARAFRTAFAPGTTRRRTASTQAMAASVTWEDLEALLKDEKVKNGMPLEEDLENGPPNPKSLRRMFGTTDEPRVKLYRDHAAWCPYCQRVWMQLEYKRIPYTLEKINMRCYGDKPEEYLRKVPSGLLPAVEIDGNLYTESAEVMLLIEQMFPDNRPLLPSQEDPLLPAAGALMKLERDMFGLWCRWCFRASDEMDASARKNFTQGLDMVNDALDKLGVTGPFLMGAEITLVDIMMAPFMERYCASLLYWKGFQLRNADWPAIDRWFEALEAEPVFAVTQSDIYTHVFDIPPQYGPPCPNQDYAKFAPMINGSDAESWRLPLSPLNATSLEPRSNTTEDGLAMQYKVEAASGLVGNYKAVAKFGLRAVGKRGWKSFTAPLADPYAKPNLDYLDPMMDALRLVSGALLQGPDAIDAKPVISSWDEETSAAVASSLAYLRDRVGVPRDMQLPAARQLRAHLNWLIDQLEPTA